MTRGESVEICSTVKMSSKDLHLRGAAQISITYSKIGKVPSGKGEEAKARREEQKPATISTAPGGMEKEVYVYGLAVLANPRYASLP